MSARFALREETKPEPWPERVRCWLIKQLGGIDDIRQQAIVDQYAADKHGLNNRSLHWVICGGESGPYARPMHPDWARSLRDQCAAAGVPFFFKQWGEWVSHVELPEEDRRPGNRLFHHWDFATWSVRVGKNRAGRLLDGVAHDAFPVVAP